MATTYLVPLGRGQQVDASGVPLAAASLYVYQSTTTTPVSLFSDSAGSSSAANPIVADSAGRLALRYTTYTGALTLVLKDSGGSTIWSQDDIYPVVHAGGLTFAGNVSVAKASAQFTVDASSGNATYILDREAGDLGLVSYRTGNVERWRAQANSTAESGANAGSDYSIQAYDDAGASLGVAFSITRATLAAAFGGALAVTGALSSASSIKSSSATAGVGYATGAGGTVTQLTSKATGVTLNKACGQITLNNAALNAGVEVTFTVTNSAVASSDAVLVNHSSAGTSGAYMVQASAIANGSFAITVTNLSAGNLSEAIVLTFAILKAVAA